MIGILALLGASPAILIALVVMIAVMVGSASILASERGRTLLRQFEWFRRLELLEPSELRYHGLIAIGLGICCFGALITARLLGPVPLWSALMLACLAVVSITLGAAFLERAGYLD